MRPDKLLSDVLYTLLEAFFQTLFEAFLQTLFEAFLDVLPIYEQSSDMTTRIGNSVELKPKTSKHADIKRRTPIQKRAEATIETILEAAARILEREGRAALNTNRIAECAGISIGTLYQYFKNKDEILLAIARKQFKSDTAVVLNAVDTVAPDCPEPERPVIRALIDLYKYRRTTRRAVVNAVISQGLASERANSPTTIAKLLLDRGGLTPTGAWVLTRAVNGVLRSTIEEESPLLYTREFEDELVRLLRSFFPGKGQS